MVEPPRPDRVVLTPSLRPSCRRRLSRRATRPGCGARCQTLSQPPARELPRSRGRRRLRMPAPRRGARRPRTPARPSSSREGGERVAVEPAGGDPVGERRRVEVDVQGIAVRRDPPRQVDADRRDLPRRAGQPDAGQAVDAGGGHAERGDRPDQRLLEVAAVAAHVPAVPGQVENRVADELPGPVVGRLAAAIDLDDLDLRALGHVHLALLGAAPERDRRRVLEQEDGVGKRPRPDRLGERALQRERLAVVDRARG